VVRFLIFHRIYWAGIDREVMVIRVSMQGGTARGKEKKTRCIHSRDL
jgi:hypothetical protein